MSDTSDIAASHEDSPGAAMVRLRGQLNAIHHQAAVIVAADAALQQEVSRAMKIVLRNPSRAKRLQHVHNV